MVARKQIKISGRVQGVGFRPYVYHIAHVLKLSGWVKNAAFGVILEIQGESTSRFIPKLLSNLPALAKIDTIHISHLDIKVNEDQFTIIDSQLGQASTNFSPDVTICSLCLIELFDTKSRFYQYPFLNCTHCGPRLTITKQLPYDRCQTSMAIFPLCQACEHDYKNPSNRRYHAQPIACSQCGPQLSSPMNEIAHYIKQGRIIALKGLGGYQLICDARNETTIATLRLRKQRKDKPFAIMLLNLASINSIANYEKQEEILLTSPERPIVLLPQKPNTLPSNIAPGLSHIGVMLPYTPIHYLLFHALLGNPSGHRWIDEHQSTVLIVTSANPGESPILIDNEQSQIELRLIANQIISHDRNIVTRVDDSVLRVVNKAPVFIRRARGYVPTSIKLAHAIPTTLALGGYLKNTFCITRDDEAFLSQHIGDLTNKATRDFFHETLQYLINFLNVKPECIAHDMHPDFYTTFLASEYNLPTFAIQHHHAHLAAVAAEYHIQEPVLGLALDGHGYGLDGGIWGGELFLLNTNHAQRLGHLLPLPIPSGDKAARAPWHMGASMLHVLGLNQEIVKRFSNQPEVALLANLLQRIDTPVSSSCGRLFDAAAALLGVHTNTQYEGQAAMKLESLVTKPEIMADGWKIDMHGLSLLPLFKSLLNLDPIVGANLFHGTLIAALADLITAWSREKHINTVLLSGGCFLNKILAEGLITMLAKSQIKALLPKLAPPNDGGIALGQAWIGGLSCA